MAIEQFDYENPNKIPVEDAPTSRIVPFDYEEVQPVTESSVQPMIATPVKPTFKKYTDLTFGEKAKLGTAKVTKGWYGGSLGAVSGLIESLSTGKDFIKGTFTRSTVAEELAKDSTFDTNVKKLASLYSNQADITSEELKNTKVALGVNPDDTFVDQLLQGTGYLTNFIATGVPTKMATMAIGFGKYAGAVANSLNVASESLMEAQDVYKEAKENGKSDMEAYEATRNTLATNALLIGLTNKVSGVFEDTAFKGIKRLFKIGASGTIEGVQEAVQQITSNYNTDKPLFQGVKDSFLIGASLGVPVAVAFDTGTKQGKEEVQKIIDESPATPEQKQIATDILEGVATEEQKQQVVLDAATNETFNIPVDETNKEALKEDIQGMITQGANIGDIVIALQAEGISQNDAENIVAEVIATPEATVVEEVVKPKAKKVAVEQAVKTPTKQEILDDEKVPKARKRAIEEIDYYLGASEAGKRVFIPESKSSNYVVKGIPSTFPQFVPENMRSRKIFDQLKPYWEKQERPGNKTPRLQKLYDLFQKDVEQTTVKNQKEIDEKMSQDDGVEFKKKESTASRETAVLDDFKKRYKVNFPTVIVDKIIQGQQTALSSNRENLANGATDGNTIALAFDAVANTAKHELIHLTLNNLDQIPEFAQFSRTSILKAQAEKMGEKFTENKAKEIEEQLALDFEAYQNKTYKPNNSVIAKFFASLSKMLKDFRSLIVKTNGDVITQYYDAVLYGESNRTEGVAITTESSVAKYLIDNVLDYRPMYQTRRVLSLSNGIKSIDFKSTEESQPKFKDALDKTMDLVNESKEKNLDVVAERETEDGVVYENLQGEEVEKPKEAKTVVNFKDRVSRADNEEYIKKTYPKYYEAIRAKLPPQKASRAFDRARARLQEEYQNDTNYTTIKIADEMAKAMEVVAQDPEYAKQVALGTAEAPLDVTDTAISLAVAETAKEKGDFKLQADAEKERSLRQTRRGQEIVMEKGRVDENSSGYFIKQVLERRKELIAQKYKPFMKKGKPFMELLDEVKENKIKKNKKIKSELEIKTEDLDSFLMSMAC